MGNVDGDIDLAVASDFVCKVYGQIKEQNVDEARLQKTFENVWKSRKGMLT